MSSKASTTVRGVVLGVSGGLHALLALGAIYTPKPERSEQVSVAVFEKEKPAEKEALDEPPPPPPPPPPPQRQAKVAPPVQPEEPLEAAEPAEAADAPQGLGEQYSGFANLGLVAGPGQGGLAVRTQPSHNQPPTLPGKRQVKKKETELLPLAKKDECEEAVVKPKPTSTVGGTYAEAARRAEVEGVVRVQITVDERGNILEAKVIKGLGYGLDEAALTAAKQWKFNPASRCGKPTVGSLTVGMRFSLGG